MPLKAIVEAIGCSKASASDIRRGKRIPHVSAKLAELAGLTLQCITFSQRADNLGPGLRPVRPDLRSS